MRNNLPRVSSMTAVSLTANWPKRQTVLGVVLMMPVKERITMSTLASLSR